MVLLSFIIPVYNLEKNIEETVNSILENCSNDFEIIIVDDGSTDETPFILKKIEAKNRNIKVITQLNHGVSVARNVGIKHSNGEYLIFCDGDDLFCNHLDIDVNRKSDLSCDMLAWRYYIANKKNAIVSQFPFEEEYYSKNEAMKQFIQGKSKIRIGSFAIKRKVLIEGEIQFTEGCAYAEDLEFIYKCLASVNRVRLINKPLYKYNYREDSIIHTYSMKKFQAPLAMERYLNYLIQKDVSVDEELISYIADTLFILHSMFAFVSNISHIKNVKIMKDFLHCYKRDYSYIENQLKRKAKKNSMKSIVFSKKSWWIFCMNREIYTYFIFYKSKFRI